MFSSKNVTVVGIDPGLVDTGIVSLSFFPRDRIIEREYAVMNKSSADKIAQVTRNTMWKPDHVFIEGYRPRSHLNTDARMMALVRDIHAAIPGSKVLNNTGIKKVVKTSVLSMLQCESSHFGMTTHHGDLESAARILLLGMYKDNDLNALVAEVVGDYLANKAWSINYI